LHLTIQSLGLGRSGRGAVIEELRDGSDELRWRERLRQHDAVRDAFGCPIVSVFATHVNDGKIGVDLSGVSGDVPAFDPLPEIDIGH
jgi:hypothetical protein